jgi:hypothetical protein
VASGGSSLTSITSSVLRGEVDVDGRVYAVFGREGKVPSLLEWPLQAQDAMWGSHGKQGANGDSEYGMPMDDAELDRIGQFSGGSLISLAHPVLFGSTGAQRHGIRGSGRSREEG